MLRPINALRRISNERKIDLGKTSPLRLLGFPIRLDNRKLQRITASKSKVKTNYSLTDEEKTKLSEFLQTTFSAYPLNIVMSNSTNVFGFSVKEMDKDIRELNGIKDETCVDPNELEKLIDYRVIDEELNPVLFNTFRNYYGAINLDKDSSITYKKIMIISLTEKFMNSNVDFLKKLKAKYSSLELNACILNPHIFAFLKNINRANQDIPSENMYNVARYGLVKVNQHKDGCLILTTK